MLQPANEPIIHSTKFLSAYFKFLQLFEKENPIKITESKYEVQLQYNFLSRASSRLQKYSTCSIICFLLVYQKVFLLKEKHI